jgi:uncharacterized lipoprotein YajG
MKKYLVLSTALVLLAAVAFFALSQRHENILNLSPEAAEELAGMGGQGILSPEEISSG